MKTIHFSVDDVIGMLKGLAEGNWTSAFQEPGLQMMKRLHDTYGCTFSCYCFYEKDGYALSDLVIPDPLCRELQSAGEWLKWGFHGRNRESNYGSRKFITETVSPDYASAYEDGKKVLERLSEWFSPSALDLLPRIHYIAGTEASCRAWKDLGMRGFLAADDDRMCFYLDEKQNGLLIRNGRYCDEKNELIFVRTDVRLENMQEDSEEFILNNYFLIDEKDHLEIFTHERFLPEARIIRRFERFAAIAVNRGYVWNYE